MRKHHLNALALAGLLGMGGLGAAAEGLGTDNDLSIDQVPPAVKTAIEREAAGQEIRWVQRGEVQGRTVYTARVRREGLDQRVVVDEAGTLVAQADLGGSSSGSEPARGGGDRSRVGLDELPAAVRQTIEREAKGEPVEWIEKDLDHGQAVYQARIRQEGLDKRVTIDERGALLSKKDWGKDDDARAAAQADDRDLEKDITLEQAPLPVQQTLTREAGGEPVQWVQRDNDEGQVVYHARIKQDGLDKRLTVAPDGSVLEKKDFSEVNAKSHAAWEKTKEKSKEAWSKTKEVSGKAWDSASDAVGGDHLTLGDLPPAVKATVEREAAGREIRDVDHEMKDGKHLYEVKIHVPDAKDVHLKVDEDGKLLEKK
jgi:uncharacterized membrane protein YkoI